MSEPEEPLTPTERYERADDWQIRYCRLSEAFETKVQAQTRLLEENAELRATVKALREERTELTQLALEVSNRASEACSIGAGEVADPQAIILAKAAEDLHSRLASEEGGHE